MIVSIDASKKKKKKKKRRIRKENNGWNYYCKILKIRPEQMNWLMSPKKKMNGEGMQTDDACRLNFAVCTSALRRINQSPGITPELLTITINSPLLNWVWNQDASHRSDAGNETPLPFTKYSI